MFLLSKAGTHGINLVSCRRIVVLEEPWNPVYNLQASWGGPGVQPAGVHSQAYNRRAGCHGRGWRAPPSIVSGGK